LKFKKNLPTEFTECFVEDCIFVCPLCIITLLLIRRLNWPIEIRVEKYSDHALNNYLPIDIYNIQWHLGNDAISEVSLQRTTKYQLSATHTSIFKISFLLTYKKFKAFM